MAYKLITIEAQGNDYPPEFLECLRQHQDDGWQMVWLTWSGDNPVILLSKAA